MNNLLSKLKKNKEYINSEKKQIKIMVYVDGVGEQEASIKENSHGGIYDGFLFDLWKWVEKDINLIAEYKTINGRHNNSNGKTYDEAIDIFRKSDYDVLLGDFSVTKNREKKIDFTRTIMLEKPIIIYRSSQGSTLQLIKESIVKFIKPFFYLILVGIIAGFFFHKIDKKARSLHWGIFGTISSLLGESGTVVEKTNPKNFKSSLFAIFILFIAFLFNIYLTARATAAQIQEQESRDPFINGIKGQIVSSQEKSFFSELLKQTGAIVAPIPIKDSISLQSKLKFWLENQKHVTGFILKESSWDFQQIYKYNLIKSKYNFGFDQIAFIVKSGKKDLLFQINNSLIKSQNKKISMGICSKYYKGKYNKYCFM